MYELTAENASSSRISEAAISQPLCTAVQIALVDLLKAAGIRFNAVVEHSSGEIAATYVAGIISLKGVMQIAYERYWPEWLIGTPSHASVLYVATTQNNLDGLKILLDWAKKRQGQRNLRYRCPSHNT